MMPEESNQFEGTDKILNEDILLSSSHGTSTSKSSESSITVGEFERFKKGLQEEMTSIEERANRSLKMLESETKQNVEKNQLKLLEVLGIYISLFTFISASIQIFARISDLFSAILVLLIILICLTIFLVLIHIVLFRNRQRGNSEKKKWRERISFEEILLAICFLFLFAIFSVGFGLNKKFNPLPSNIEFGDDFEKWTDSKIDKKFEIFNSTTSASINQINKDTRQLNSRVQLIESKVK